MGFISKIFDKDKAKEVIVFNNTKDEFLHKCKGWGEKDYDDYIEKFIKGDIQTIDFTTRTWGHSFEITPMKGNVWLYDVLGWCSNPRIKAGDYIKASTTKGIVKLQVMAVDYVDDPNDMFFGVLVNHGIWSSEEEVQDEY